MKKAFFILSLFFSTWTFATVQDSIASVTKDGTTYTQYLVSPGETVYRLSTTHNISITELMTDNPTLEYGLKVGQIILLRNYVRTTPAQKVADESQFESEEKNINPNHVVQKGETYYGLSKKYGIPLNDLLEWNGAGLKEGQVLVVQNPKKEPITEKPAVVVEKTPTTPAKPTEKKPVEKPVTTNPEPSTPVVIMPAEPKPVVEKPTPKPTPAVEVAEAPAPKIEEILEKEDLYDFDSTKQQILFVPFDPHLYWSDADEEIRRGSNLKTRLEVRKIIRRRLNALLDPMGYENIHLLGGRFRDTLTDLNKIYSSVSYDYQTAIVSEAYKKSLEEQEANNKDDGEVTADNAVKTSFNNLRNKLALQTTEEETKLDTKADKYFGVIIKDHKFFDYFNRKYDVDYYVFINQFEIITDYNHCLDRTTQNYRRYFVVHFSIFDYKGKQIAGNKYKQFYDSNSNNIDRITGDNLQKMADRVLLELPLPR